MARRPRSRRGAAAAGAAAAAALLLALVIAAARAEDASSSLESQLPALQTPEGREYLASLSPAEVASLTAGVAQMSAERRQALAQMPLDAVKRVFAAATATTAATTATAEAAAAGAAGAAQAAAAPVPAAVVAAQESATTPAPTATVAAAAETPLVAPAAQPAAAAPAAEAAPPAKTRAGGGGGRAAAVAALAAKGLPNDDGALDEPSLKVLRALASLPDARVRELAALPPEQRAAALSFFGDGLGACHAAARAGAAPV